ncbi:sugar ABC transporter ATP-binding protein [Citricoccus sp. K5]|uniref:sugar ABC transporter ATP-binding protein n=1 Tax=Citricoccus sp. K5 TaxID=2653135 RepID=UPI001359A1C5|nr:sugar ABC transporter ATP-binding protein [Citricoccus sp. K5]
MTQTDAPFLEVRNLSKRYGTFTALDSTDLIVESGSIHGFLGKNGAGKSTIVKIIAGSERPTSGQVLFKGVDITDWPLARRRKAGINLLPQHAEIVPELSVAENLVLPDYPTSGMLLNKKRLRTMATELLAKYDLHFDVEARAGDLSTPDQRRLTIVRTLVDDGSFAMLDEPTTALSQIERESLFTWMRSLNAKGQTFAFISHYSSEIRAICNTVTVLRDGHVVADKTDPSAMTAHQISELVVGGAVDEYVRDRRDSVETKVRVQGLRIGDTGPVDFTVGKGEVLGLVGLPGSGAQETARALGGLTVPEVTRIEINGKEVSSGSVKAATDAGIEYLTNDRHGEGIVGPFSVSESIVTGRWPSKGGLIDRKSIRDTYEAFHRRMRFRVSGPGQAIEQLSGGNQQKILLSRIMAVNPELLILDEPTLGVDVAAKEEIHRIINDLTEAGTSVIVLAYDIDEMVRVVDRVLTFQDGRIVASLTGEDISPDNILLHLNHQSSDTSTAA